MASPKQCSIRVFAHTAGGKSPQRRLRAPNHSSFIPPKLKDVSEGHSSILKVVPQKKQWMEVEGASRCVAQKLGSKRSRRTPFKHTHTHANNEARTLYTAFKRPAESGGFAFSKRRRLNTWFEYGRRGRQDESTILRRQVQGSLLTQRSRCFRRRGRAAGGPLAGCRGTTSGDARTRCR